MRTKSGGDTLISILLIVIIGTLLLWSSMPVHALRVVEGSLGSWLEREASPRLVEMLIKHPRLKGQRLKIMGIQDGNPVALNNRLGADIKDQLTQDLLAQAGIQLIFNEHSGCTTEKVNLILGIDTRRRDNNRHRVTVAMVDVEEGLWLSGANFSWSGRLTNLQDKAFRTRIASPALQTSVDISRSNEISRQLIEQLACLPTLKAPIFFTASDSSVSQGVVLRLKAHFEQQSKTTLNAEAAGSLLRVQQTNLPGEQSELVLSVASVEQPKKYAPLAQVVLAGRVAALQPAAYTQNNRPVHLLSALSISKRSRRLAAGGVCKDRSTGCVQVAYELFRPAYVVSFYTRNGVPVPESCHLGQQRTVGKHLLHVKVPRGSAVSRPTLGVYTLAFNQRGPAEILQRELNLGAPSCTNKPSDVDAWVSSFTHALARYEKRMDWQTLHMMRDANGVRAL